MPSTYTLISSTVLANSTTANVTFSGIPATFTDLELRYATRSTTDTPLTELNVAFNGTSFSTTDYSSTVIRAQGSGGSTSARYSNSGTPRFVISEPTTYTANTFANGSVYIPNYLSLITKPLALNGVVATNTSTQIDANVMAASQYRNTSAITSMFIQGAGNFVTGSSFFLYGILKG
jgi:hypothetical protein